MFAAACGAKSAGPPAVSHIDPARMAPGQPTFLIVEGSNFARNASVTIGGQTAAATWVNRSVLTLVAPASLSSGSYDVTVRNPGSPDATLRNGLTVAAGAAPPAAGAATPTPLPSVTAQATPSPAPSPTPSPSPSPSPTPSPTPSPRPTPSPTPTPSPAPSPSPSPTPLPVSALEGIVCQPSEFGNQQPAHKQQISNDATGDPATAARLTRLDGYRVTYGSFPGTRNSAPISASTDCYVELYGSADGALQAVQAQQIFPANVNVHETPFGGPGGIVRSFEGSYVDDRGQILPYTLIKWQDGRFVGSVTIVGATNDLARPAVLTLATAMDGRMMRAAQPGVGR